MNSDLLEELRSFRQSLRDLKAGNLREMRRYEREMSWSSMSDFMRGLAVGKECAISRLELMIYIMELRDDTQNI